MTDPNYPTPWDADYEREQAIPAPPDALSKGIERLTQAIDKRAQEYDDMPVDDVAHAVLASDNGLAGMVEIVVEKSEHRCCCGGEDSCIPCRARAALKEFADG